MEDNSRVCRIRGCSKRRATAVAPSRLIPHMLFQLHALALGADGSLDPQLTQSHRATVVGALLSPTVARYESYSRRVDRAPSRVAEVPAACVQISSEEVQ